MTMSPGTLSTLPRFFLQGEKNYKQSMGVPVINLQLTVWTNRLDVQITCVLRLSLLCQNLKFQIQQMMRLYVNT